MKTRFDIEIKDSKKVSGGYLMTTEPMTEKQVVKHVEKMGREMMANNKAIDRLSYSCWEADTEDYDNAVFVGIILSRLGRKVIVTTY